MISTFTEYHLNKMSLSITQNRKLEKCADNEGCKYYKMHQYRDDNTESARMLTCEVYISIAPQTPLNTYI